MRRSGYGHRSLPPLAGFPGCMLARRPGGGATVPGTNDGDPLWTADDGGRARPRCALSIVGGVRRGVRVRGRRRRRRQHSRPSTAPTGEWARYFRGADGYRGTELLRATRRDGHAYLVIDRWELGRGVRALPRRARGGLRAAQPGRRAPLPAGDGPRPVRRAALSRPPCYAGVPLATRTYARGKRRGKL